MGLQRVEWWWGIALALVLMVIVIPMRTSLGQGVREFRVISWQEEYQTDTGHFYLRINGAASPPIRIALAKTPLKNFSDHRGLTWFTPSDMPSVIHRAFIMHPHQVESALGTRHNVFAIGAMFPRQPVAYTPQFLWRLAELHLNPRVWGGPNVPPNGQQTRVLQIDTRADANTLLQCQPGEMPPELKAWGESLRRGRASLSPGHTHLDHAHGD